MNFVTIKKQMVMAKLVLTPENQIQRLNHIIHSVTVLKDFSVDDLTDLPKAKAWSILEIIEHLNIAYSFYETRINEVLHKAGISNEDSWSFKTRLWQRFVIEGQRPKGEKRKWKMKTLRRFEPVLSEKEIGEEKILQVFETFFRLHGHLKTSIIASRNKNVRKLQLNSAIGPIVRFYLPEAFEFLICHAERHLVQIHLITTSGQKRI